MSEAPIDQTRFTMEAPTPQTPAQPTVSQEKEEKSIRKPISLPIFIVAVVLIMGLLLGAIYLSQKKSDQHVIVATPEPTEQPLQTSEIQSQIQPYFDQIEGLNPEDNDHPFPPVDYTVRIKDPNARP